MPVAEPVAVAAPTTVWDTLRTGLGDRLTTWTDALKDTPFAPVLAADAMPQARISAWLNCISKQEDLFDIAIQIIRKTLGSATESPDAIDARGSELMPYIQDVERFIQFTPDVATEDLTKLQRISTMPLSELLAFPGHLTNTTVTTFAGIIASLVKEPTVLDRAAESPAIRRLLAAQFRALVFANAYYLTASEPRDGYFLNQGTKEFLRDLNGSPSVFTEFVDELVRLHAAAAPVSALFKKPAAAAAAEPCATSLRDASKSWGFVAAHMARLAMLEPEMKSLFTLFQDCSAAPAPTNLNAQHLPPQLLPSETAEVITIDDAVPLRPVFQAMGDTTFQFILHLRERIRSLPTVTVDDSTP